MAVVVKYLFCNGNLTTNLQLPLHWVLFLPKYKIPERWLNCLLPLTFGFYLCELVV